jgi:hypothetical protein
LKASDATNSRIVEMSDYMMSLKAFQAWSLKEMSMLAHAVRTIVHYRGQMIFEQGAPVKGIYILWHGSAKMENMQDVQGTGICAECATAHTLRWALL